MISVNVICVGKNSRLDDKNIVTDITFHPLGAVETHARGAVIGVPDPNSTDTEKLQEPQQPRYNLTSGGVSINVTNAKEADAYQIGETYQLTINTSAVTPPAKK